ncbi:hypothetical protein H4219_006206 [Mycoemilia scoparia]|uniref:Nudix hydrolase domain-containing protein n=1 Tax=Mycoemilia scoparia TaxID=417184 RepID=A0A9W8DJD5_9FUNG|nr:hypothetical protein H4219_006206 [Mycoemilia scoparia]
MMSDPNLNKDVLVGLLRPEMITGLERFNSTFLSAENTNVNEYRQQRCLPPFVIDHKNHTLGFSPSLYSLHQSSLHQRNKVMEMALDYLRSVEAWIPALSKWRNEKFPIYGTSSSLLLSIERAASYTFGIRQYAVYINGYITVPKIRTTSSSSNHSASDSNREIKIWVAQRSLTKETWAGYLDQMVAGGIATNHGLSQTVIKECQEEAGIPPRLARFAKPVSSIQYFTESRLGLQPETLFTYDLEMPADFVPMPNDGEVESFYLWSIEKVSI